MTGKIYQNKAKVIQSDQLIKIEEDQSMIGRVVLESEND